MIINGQLFGLSKKRYWHWLTGERTICPAAGLNKTHCGTWVRTVQTDQVAGIPKGKFCKGCRDAMERQWVLLHV